MDHQKPSILLIFGTFSLGGCGGHPMTPKLDLKNEEIRIINNGDYVTIDPLFKDINNSKNINSKYLMLLNFQSEINKDIYSSKIENIGKYSVKYRLGNCYLLELND